VQDLVSSYVARRLLSSHMKRYHITLGARTNVGGHVISASSPCSVDGAAMAVEGDRLYCPACQSEGVIRCVGPRLVNQWEGVDLALEHDLCVCRCVVHPTLLTGQSLSFQDVEGEILPTAQLTPAPPVVGQTSTLCLECLVAAAARGESVVLRG